MRFLTFSKSSFFYCVLPCSSPVAVHSRLKIASFIANTGTEVGSVSGKLPILLKKTTITIMGPATEDEVIAHLGNRPGQTRDGSGRIEVDVRVPVGLPIPEVADFVRRCESAGINGVGIHDHHHSGRDVYVALAYA